MTKVSAESRTFIGRRSSESPDRERQPLLESRTTDDEDDFRETPNVRAHACAEVY
jgi:hypothetical protein